MTPNPSPSLAARLWDWLTVEVQPERPPIRRVHVPRRGLASTARGVSDTGHPPTTAVGGPGESAPADSGTPSPALPPGPRGMRQPRRQARQPLWVRRRPWAAGGLALVGLCAAAVLAGHVGRPSPHHTTAGATSAPHSTGAAHPASAAPANPSASGATVSGSPDCAAKGMQPVVTPAGHQAVPGLCFSLGDGRSWIIGCTRAACDPPLQSVIACVRQAGARQQGVVTESNISACAVPAAEAAGAAPSG